jgi:hypothetical protein
MTFPRRAGANAPALFFALLFFLSACTTISLLQPRPDRATATANQNNWRLTTFNTPHFKIIGYRPNDFGRITSPKSKPETLNIYLEGDGVAWVTETLLSRDPTPSEPLTLQLAIQDPTSSTLYLARPCQYLAPHALARCSPIYWSSHRYSEEVVSSVSNAIEQAKQAADAKHIRLFGYSGGGALAILIAARRADIIQITTMAANLDHHAWTQQGGFTPLYGSLNPAQVANKVSHIPQVHFIGADDKVVPESVTNAYMSGIRDTSRIRIVKLRDVDHDCCWTQNWNRLLQDHVYR